MKSQELDPLYVIFEQHLTQFEDSDADRKTFIEGVLRDYLSYLRKLNITVPKSLESSIFEELAGQVQIMLVKKIYGCLSLSDYRRKLTPIAKRTARKRYARLKR